MPPGVTAAQRASGEGGAMNWDTIKGQWKQFRGEAKQRWGKLTDDDMQRIDGSKDKLVGTIQERYGYAKDEAEREVDDWIRDR